MWTYTIQFVHGKCKNMSVHGGLSVLNFIKNVNLYDANFIKWPKGVQNFFSKKHCSKMTIVVLRNENHSIINL